jgi:glycolate dehydrogenase FAD-linked subunit
MPCLRQEVGHLAGVEPLLPLAPEPEQLLTPPAELALKRRNESECVRREYPFAGLARVREHLYTCGEHGRHARRLTRVALERAFTEAVLTALPPGAVLTEHEDLRTYECDGLTGRRVIPALVCLPETTDEVQAVVRACAAHRIPFVARGAGTGLSGGALPVAEGIVISLARMNRVLDVDIDAQRVVVQPGVTNLEVTQAVSAEGFYYAPDPSSQQVCTIGGNVAENSGGAHCLKYGFTVNHVLAAVVVLPDGEVVELSAEGPGPDLLGVFVGSEGTLGIATEVTLRVLRRPERIVTLLAAFHSTDAAGGAVSNIVGAGILPAAIEMMDRLTIEAAEAGVGAGYPEGASAVLIVELDGVAAQVEDDLARVEAICLAAGAFELRIAAGEAERALLWLGRKSAFAAMGRISESYYVQDGVVPRTKLPDVLREIARLEGVHGLRVGNVFHAGDGNLHPLVLYDARVEGEAERARELADAILVACVDAGGSITGEHGVGTDKACSMPLLFSEDDLEAMQRLRRAFDPDGIANPGKLFPTPRLCGEVPGPYRQHPLERLGLAERF